MTTYRIHEDSQPMSDITYAWEHRNDPVWARFLVPFRVLPGSEYTVVKEPEGRTVAKLDPIAGMWREH